jgi:hypothetical protein
MYYLSGNKSGIIDYEIIFSSMSRFFGLFGYAIGDRQQVIAVEGGCGS